MDVDPIDDGPAVCVTKAAPLATLVPVYGSSLASHNQQLLLQQQPAQQQQQSSVVTEEEARQFIEMLRSEDVSSRVSAANRLDVVAMALGSDRTRDVRKSHISFPAVGVLNAPFSILILTFMP